MAVSSTEIANQALTRLGEKPILDISDGTNPRARAVEVVYETVRQEVFRSGEWNSLLTRVSLPRDVAAPTFGWEYAYEIPTDCVRVVSVNETQAWPSSGDYFVVEGSKVLTNQEEVNLLYVKDETNARKYDALLVNALATLLAARLATIFRQDENLAMQLEEEYRRSALPRASTVDGNERRVIPYNPATASSWVNSRRYNG